MEIQPGSKVRCRDALGTWHEAVAESEVRIDYPNLTPRQEPYESVMVRFPHREYAYNWPAEDVEAL